ncbi:hypothetical protein TNCV_4696161 [Trichonephila clavipes]|nr:hypothetical protein TNCV_4696161 [Trichonephila clavipes]
MADRGILEFAQSSKNIIDSVSDDENERISAAPVLASAEMRNVMKKHSLQAGVENMLLNSQTVQKQRQKQGFARQTTPWRTSTLRAMCYVSHRPRGLTQRY